jgi:N,N-dimethylformamidase
VVSVGRPLLTGVWYLVWGSYDPGSGRLAVEQEPVLGAYNGRLALRHPTDGLADAAAAGGSLGGSVPGDVALMVGAWQELRLDTGRVVPAGHFNGKIDRPRVVARGIERDEVWRAVTAPLTVTDMYAAWDFAANISRHGVVGHAHAEDLTANRLHGRLVNGPARGMTGYNWSGTEYSFRHAPDEYGAIHFHDDDLTDCEWEATCEFTVPAALGTGIYAARIGASVDGVAEEDYIPFFVRPARAWEPGAVHRPDGELSRVRQRPDGGRRGGDRGAVGRGAAHERERSRAAAAPRVRRVAV